MRHTEVSAKFSSSYEVGPFDCQGSVAKRKPSPKKRGSYVGHIVDPFRGRRIYYESHLEYQWASVWVADHRVQELCEQQYVKFREGRKLRMHCVDFVVHLKGGWKVGHSIKYRTDVMKSGLEGVVSAVSAHSDNRHVADDFRITREIDLNLLDFKNARKIIAYGKMRDYEAQDFIKQSLPDLPEEISPREIATRLKMGRRGEKAAIALLQSGLLQLRDHTAITVDSRFINQK
ncbi:hypothetical protein [Roseibium alexandrii]|uniref:hypothetical protein n=1 Tax=Roseibium alexandrii TaxID=388408 RepID=UPI003752DE4F